MEVIELKNKKLNWKITTEGLNISLDKTEESISELYERVMEIKTANQNSKNKK